MRALTWSCRGGLRVGTLPEGVPGLGFARAGWIGCHGSGRGEGGGVRAAPGGPASATSNPFLRPAPSGVTEAGSRGPAGGRGPGHDSACCLGNLRRGAAIPPAIPPPPSAPLPSLPHPWGDVGPGCGGENTTGKGRPPARRQPPPGPASPARAPGPGLKVQRAGPARPGERKLKINKGPVRARSACGSGQAQCGTPSLRARVPGFPSLPEPQPRGRLPGEEGVEPRTPAGGEGPSWGNSTARPATFWKAGRRGRAPGRPGRRRGISPRAPSVSAHQARRSGPAPRGAGRLPRVPILASPRPLHGSIPETLPQHRPTLTRGHAAAPGADPEAASRGLHRREARVAREGAAAGAQTPAQSLQEPRPRHRDGGGGEAGLSKLPAGRGGPPRTRAAALAGRPRPRGGGGRPRAPGGAGRGSPGLLGALSGCPGGGPPQGPPGTDATGATPPTPGPRRPASPLPRPRPRAPGPAPAIGSAPGPGTTWAAAPLSAPRGSVRAPGVSSSPGPGMEQSHDLARGAMAPSPHPARDGPPSGAGARGAQEPCPRHSHPVSVSPGRRRRAGCAGVLAPLPTFSSIFVGYERGRCGQHAGLHSGLPRPLPGRLGESHLT